MVVELVGSVQWPWASPVSESVGVSVDGHWSGVDLSSRSVLPVGGRVGGGGTWTVDSEPLDGSCADGDNGDDLFTDHVARLGRADAGRAKVTLIVLFDNSDDIGEVSRLRSTDGSGQEEGKEKGEDGLHFSAS